MRLQRSHFQSNPWAGTKSPKPKAPSASKHWYTATESAVKTRFGTVSVRDDDKALLFKGKPVQPAIEGNSNLHIVARYNGALTTYCCYKTPAAAPATQFRIAILAKGLKISPAFGTCSDLIYPSFDVKRGDGGDGQVRRAV